MKKLPQGKPYVSKGKSYQFVALETSSSSEKTHVYARSRTLENWNINLSDEQTNANPKKMKFLAYLWWSIYLFYKEIYFLEFFPPAFGFSISKVWMMTYLENNCFHSILPGSSETFKKLQLIHIRAVTLNTTFGNRYSNVLHIKNPAPCENLFFLSFLPVSILLPLETQRGHNIYGLGCHPQSAFWPRVIMGGQRTHLYWSSPVTCSDYTCQGTGGSHTDLYTNS